MYGCADVDQMLTLRLRTELRGEIYIERNRASAYSDSGYNDTCGLLEAMESRCHTFHPSGISE